MTARPRAAAAGGHHGDLPDVNVWLALAVTHYDRFAALPEVSLAAEPAGTGAAMRHYVGAGLPARLITDAYLAAFAAAGARTLGSGLKV